MHTNGPGGALVSGRVDGQVLVWEAATGVLLREIAGRVERGVTCVAGGSLLFAGDSAGEIAVLDRGMGAGAGRFGGLQSARLFSRLRLCAPRSSSLIPDRVPAPPPAAVVRRLPPSLWGRLPHHGTALYRPRDRKQRRGWDRAPPTGRLFRPPLLRPGSRGAGCGHRPVVRRERRGGESARFPHRRPADEAAARWRRRPGRAVRAQSEKRGLISDSANDNDLDFATHVLLSVLAYSN